MYGDLSSFDSCTPLPTHTRRHKCGCGVLLCLCIEESPATSPALHRQHRVRCVFIFCDDTCVPHTLSPLSAMYIFIYLDFFFRFFRACGKEKFENLKKNENSREAHILFCRSLTLHFFLVLCVGTGRERGQVCVSESVA